MRCPKCGYISFDHNQICPKCNKDISDEQAKLNLPTYKNNPPSLLGMLTGAGDESSVGFTLDSDAALRDAGVGLDFEETSSMIDGADLEFGENDQDLEISLNDDTGEFELPELDMDEKSGDMSDIDLGSEDEELSLDMDEVSFEDSDDTSDDLDLDLGEVSIEDEDGDVGDSLDGISPNDSIVLEGVSDFSPEAVEETMEIDPASIEGTKLTDKKGKPTVELNVSDLKINETGELEINSIPDEIVSPGELPEEDEINIDEIDIDSETDLEPETSSDEQIDDKNVTGSLDLSDLTLDAANDLNIDEVGGSDTAEIPVLADEEILDLGDLAIDEDSEGEKSFDLSDLTLDDVDIINNDETPQADDLDFDGKETGELNVSDLEERKSEKSSSIDTEKTLGLDDSISLDLENLDLDLDLDDTGDEK